MFDVVITVAEKDFNKLPFVLKAIEANVQAVNNYYLISQLIIPQKYMGFGAKSYLDASVIDFDFSKITMRNRRGWYRQQFIKLFQQVSSDNYLVIDADALIHKPLIINERHPDFYIGRDQLHQPYFDLMKTVFGLDRVYNHSFISEMMYFKRGVIDEIVKICGSKNDFFDACVEVINSAGNVSGFSEYELYGNYVTKYHSAEYGYKQINVCHNWKRRLWSNEEIIAIMRKYKNNDCELITMHSWI